VRPERFVVPLAAIVLAVFGTSRLIEAIDPGADRASGEGRSVAADERPPEPGSSDRRGERKRGAKPRRHRSSSFLAPTGMRQLKALLASEAGSGGRVTLFRVQADAAQVHVARRGGGGGGLLVIEKGPRVRFRASTPVAVPGGFSLSELDPYAPSRIGSAIARLSSASLADVDYMVFVSGLAGNPSSWEAFLANAEHTHFHADAHGRDVTRP
jgi:hypothetical protein